MIIDIVVAFALIGITLMQHKEDQGLSSTITGAAANNFFLMILYPFLSVPS